MQCLAERDPTPPAAHVAGQLIDCIGRPDFSGRLLSLFKTMLNADLISILRISHEQPLLLEHRTLAAPFDEDHAIRHYLGGLFLDDPVLDYIRNGMGDRAAATLYMTKAQVPSIAYRRHCYERAHIADRLTVACRTASGEALSVNLYRGEAAGPLDEDELRCAAEIAPLLATAVARHSAVTLARLEHDMDRTLLHLIERFPTLTMREAQCAAGAVVGLTAGAIGAKLGIKASSVITHRKRAYERLGVAGQKELTRRFYAAG